MKKKQLCRCILVLGLILGLKDGCVALWKNGNPIQIYSFQAKYLPLSDQKMLKSGIPIHSDAELTKLLEDYFS